MAMNRIQFQPGLSMPAFAQRFGTESQCAAALEAARWPNGFSCPRCGGTAHCVLRGGSCKVFQCQACRHQTSLIAGTVFQGTKLPLTVWFLAIYLISQAKTGSMPFRVEADNSGLSSSHRFLMIETLFTLALGLVAPWQVDQVTFTPEAGRIDFQVKFGAASHACPACGAAAQPLHDRLARSWRHRDFFEYEARLHAEVPRVACAGCGKVTQILVPWAREGVAKVAVALKLDYKSLKHRLTARNAAEDARSAPMSPSFVELDLGLPLAPPVCVLVLTDRAGRALRIELPPAASGHIVEVARIRERRILLCRMRRYGTAIRVPSPGVPVGCMGNEESQRSWFASPA